MNLFIFDKDTHENAKFHPDKYIVKMPTEACQVISTVLRGQGDSSDFLFKSTHARHPVTLWAAEKEENLVYVAQYCRALLAEYDYRFGKKDKFVRSRLISNYVLGKFQGGSTSDFALAMPEIYKNKDAVLAYREYFKNEKKHLFNWENREIPEWLNLQKNNKVS